MHIRDLDSTLIKKYQIILFGYVLNTFEVINIFWKQLGGSSPKPNHHAKLGLSNSVILNIESTKYRSYVREKDEIIERMRYFSLNSISGKPE